MANVDNGKRHDEMERYRAAIEEETFRNDGYRNMLNKVGTTQDNSRAWTFDGEPFITTDMELARIYESNGLFAKIIDRPAEDAIAKGLDLSDLGEELEAKVKRKLIKLNWTDVFVTAEKWARLFGGAIAVMLVDDGRGLEEPLDYANARGIEEIRVFERAIVQPDYTTLFSYSMYDMGLERDTPWGQPVYYNVYSTYGCFRVHYSRCLIFKNGKLPEYIATGLYRFWGIPVYNKIKDALRETITSHHDGTKLLERSVLGVYKMKNLATLLSTDEGENKVIQRLQVIDMARNIINSMAIDADGEDYQYINASMSGAKDLIDSTCNMLSAVTDIPQTILFGRSPSGMDATGDNDMDNYLQLLARIQSNDMQSNVETVIRLVLLELARDGEIDGELPEYEVRFVPQRQMTEQEQADIDNIKAGIESTKASTAQIYVDMQALDPSEVRKGLMGNDAYSIQELIDENAGELEVSPEDLPEDEEQLQMDSGNPNHDPKTGRFSSGSGGGLTSSGSGAKINAGKSVDYKGARQFTKELRGTVASNGVRLKEVSPHAAYRIKEWGFTLDDVRSALTDPEINYPGNAKHKNSTCFQRGNMRLVYSEDGVVITTIDLKKGGRNGV